jgi:hypothetical protein
LKVYLARFKHISERVVLEDRYELLIHVCRLTMHNLFKEEYAPFNQTSEEKDIVKKLLLIGILALILPALLLMQTAFANPDPLEVSWNITDVYGNPINGAKLTIYWSTSTNGPFSIVPADTATVFVVDKVDGVTSDPPGPPKMSGPKQNPIISGYWNPTYTAGMAICDLHVTGISGYYFYAKIEAGSDVWYWPVATSTKPGDATWAPVAASGSPSGYATAGNGMGTGPTTAFPTRPPPTPGAPEFPIDTAAIVSVTAMLFFALTVKRKKPLQK